MRIIPPFSVWRSAAGGKAVLKTHAVQTLREVLRRWASRERLDCGGFNTAFGLAVRTMCRPQSGTVCGCRIGWFVLVNQFYMMKKIVFSILVAVAFVPGVRAALYLEEAFPYATGALNAQPGWSGGSGSQVIAGSLSFPGLQSPTVTSNKASLPATASTAFKSFNASPIASGSVYLSFIFKQNTLATSTSGSTIAGLDDDGTVTTGSGRVASALGVHVKQTNSTTYLVGIRKAQGTGAGGGTDVFYTGANFVVGDVLFVVAKYSFGAGAGDDTVTLWVNPATNSFGGIEPVASIAATNTGNTTDAAQLQYVFVRCNSSTTSGINEIDDVRVGNTWADVTPNGGVVQPPATNSQPRITQTFLSAGGLVLRGTNGVTNGVYQVLSSTTVAAPMTNWPAIGTNLFDASGNFDCTNPVSPVDAQRFYRILVGGQITQPNITTQPTNLTVLAGQTATFVGAASGTAPLAYQWFFNTNTPLTDGTNATYVITNAQAANEGSYFLRVTNSAGSVTSVVATLTVNVPPTISTQPQSQTVTASNAASFTVIAAGDAPLSYQWYFSSAPILNGTNATHAISGATTNDAGNYFVTVNNPYGSVTSSVVTLTVNPFATNQSPVGFATYNYTITGGQGGAVFVATNAASLTTALNSTTARIVQVVGTITATGNIPCKNNKTIIGLGNNATIIGDLNISHATNVIVQNIHFSNPTGVGDGDGMTVEYSEHVWIDHCTFYDCSDGSLDVTHGSDWVTISWCKFYYTANTGHNFVNLVGHSDNNASEDSGRLHVTFHHNWWSTLCVERMPRVRFGQVHVFNNYADTPGNNYCVRASLDSEVLVENNHYENLDSPCEYFAPNGLIKAVGNATVNCTGVQAFNDAIFAASSYYSYTLETPAAAKAGVISGAGAGTGLFP